MAILPKDGYVAQMDAPYYGESIEHTLPELTSGTPITTAPILLRRLFKDAGLDAAHYGSAKWNPLGDIIDDRLIVLYMLDNLLKFAARIVHFGAFYYR